MNANQSRRDPVVELYKRDIDMTLLRENLRRSVDERVSNLMALQRLAEEARRAGQRHRAAEAAESSSASASNIVDSRPMSNTKGAYNGGLTALARAESIAPKIAQAADEIDAERELPVAIADEMKALGLFRLLLPRSVGGEEMPWPEYLQAVRAIAYADGSAGWCFNQGTVFATTCCRAPEALAEEVWADPSTVVANGPPQGPVEARPVAGGVRLTGRWMFSSGCRHANWVAALVANRGEPPCLHLLPRDDVEFIDVWQVKGLRGTGSFSFRADGAFIPEKRTMRLDVPPREPGPLYVIPQGLLFACGFGCVALGVARAGLDATIELCSDKRPRFGSRPLCEDPVIQQQIGKAEAKWRAAKALLEDATQTVWDAVTANGEITMEERILLRMSGTHAIRQSAEVVDIAYNLSGSTSIFADRAIQRRFQDIHVITQQVQGREAHYETAGQFFLGLDPKGVI